MDLSAIDSNIDVAISSAVLMIMSSNSNLSTTVSTTTNTPNDNLINHHLVSTNSFELNTATSLSDDSGIPHTNSSISSNGSSRFGLCKYEFELVESDGEVSQFDSLDNCSDGGMSAENFNTLKKVPLLAPIDPPPEFQDSPQTTLLRSQALQNYALKLATNLISNAYTTYTIAHLPLTPPPIEVPTSIYNNSEEDIYSAVHDDRDLNLNTVEYNSSSCNKDSKKSSYNIYDEPPVTTTNSGTSGSQNSNPKIKLKKMLYSPLHHGSNLSTINRPNSRNSLNSRLSSSHNSLSVISSNKVDDSIFISQAMSHDPLLGRDIIDFYNVPIDSDIYTLPIDFVKNNSQITTETTTNQTMTTATGTTVIGGGGGGGSGVAKNGKILRSKLKYTKNGNFTKKRRGNHSNATTSMNTINTNINTNNNLNNNNYNNKDSGGVSGVCGKFKVFKTTDKRHSVPENGITDPSLHLSLDEVRRYYTSVYSSSNESLDNLITTTTKKNPTNLRKGGIHSTSNSNHSKTMMLTSNASTTTNASNSQTTKSKKHSNRKGKDEQNQSNNPTRSNHTTAIVVRDQPTSTTTPNNNNNNLNNNNHNISVNNTTSKKSQFSINFKQKFCSIFRFRGGSSSSNGGGGNKSGTIAATTSSTSHPNLVGNHKLLNHSHNGSVNYTNMDYANAHLNENLDNAKKKTKFSTRALPPLPATQNNNNNTINNMNVGALDAPQPGTLPGVGGGGGMTTTNSATTIDFATNIEQVKKKGWYWGPLSGEAAEKILSNEPDGSFIVRDSSDDHYIFSLSLMLSGCVRHVRIEQDEGEFSFGPRAIFKSRTITEFIENAVEHSRSGRYVFFFHRRPEHGPVPVQLTNPLSRFRHIQSLQHLCRFVILKTVVRKDLIQTLPLPRRILDYLSYKNCYSEQIESDSSQSQQNSGDGVAS